MRVLIVTNLYPNPFQPQRATFNRELVKALARHHHLSVIAPIAWTEEFAARRAGHPPLPRGRRLEWDGIPVEYPRVLFVPRVFRSRYGHFFRWSIRPAFQRAIAEFKPDVVFAPWVYPDGWAAVNLAHRAGLPVVLNVLGSDVRLLSQYPARRQGTIQALRGADRVVTVSQDLSQMVVQLGVDPTRVEVVYRGVNLAAFHSGDQADARRDLGLDLHRPAILYVGNLVPVKGPDVLIEACAQLVRRNVDFDLHVIGRGPLRPGLERQAADSGLGNRVRFHGVIAHDRLPVWFRAASLLALPSRSEGVPNVLLEASACGTPWVASRVGGVPEIAHLGAGRLVTPDDPTELADAIVETLTSPPTAAAKHRPARTHEDAARELVSVFKAALGQAHEVTSYPASGVPAGR